MIEHIEICVQKSLGPDAILVTGDIGYSGKKSEYINATKYFDKILASAELSRRDLFVVPGNHDVDRDGIAGLARTLYSNQQSDKYFDKINACPHALLGQNNYGNWFNEYFRGIRTFSTNTSYNVVEKFTKNEINISICMFNSALFCQDDADPEKLFIGRRALDDACKEIADLNCRFSIALLHHPFSYLSSIERVVCERKIDDNFDLVLSGHLHETEASFRFNGETGALRLVAGATYQGAPWKCAAQWLKIDDVAVRVEPICYHKSPSPVWTRDTAMFPTSEDDYCRSFSLTEAKSVASKSSVTNSVTLNLDDKSLFQTRAGKPIFVEPRVCDIPISGISGATTYQEFSIDQLVNATQSLHIECNNEHGGSTLAKILHEKINQRGETCLIYSAFELPNYEKKLKEFLIPHLKGGLATLIIDDFDRSQHKKLIIEISKCKLFSKLIVLAPVTSITGSMEIFSAETEFEFMHLHLWGLDRQRIRSIATEIFDSPSEAIISAAVDKTYSDLNNLCIPLTPTNVIMYLQILWKESEFHPLDRIGIMERYLSEVLTRNSDIFSGNFNLRNRLDLISSFSYHLFQKENNSFSENEFVTICMEYSKASLLEFDFKETLASFKKSRIIVDYGPRLFFRYSFLFSYLLEDI